MGARTIPFNPSPGKLGSVTVSGLGTLNVTEWEPTQKNDEIEVTNFNSPTDYNGNVHQEYIPGTVGTTFTVSGPRDNGPVGWDPTAGDQGLATLLYAPGFGFSFSFIVTDVGGGQKVKEKAEFNCTIRATGLCVIFGG